MGKRIAGYELPDSLSEPTTIQAEASALKRRFEAQVADIRAEGSLSDEGKRTMIARAWQAFKPAFDRLQQKEQADYAKALTARQHKLVGLLNKDEPGALISFRDAMARAEALPRGGLAEVDREKLRLAAESLFRQAELSGDDVLARAVLCVAIDRGVDSIVDAYKRRNPEDTESIDGYFELQKHDPDKSQVAYYTWQARSPQEISGIGMDEKSIAALAAENVFDVSRTTSAEQAAWGV